MSNRVEQFKHVESLGLCNAIICIWHMPLYIYIAIITHNYNRPFTDHVIIYYSATKHLV